MSPLVPTSLSRTNRIFSLRMYARSRLEGDERCPAGTNGRDEEDRRRQKTTNRGNENSLVGSCLLFPVLAIVVDRFIHLAVCLSFGSNQTNGRKKDNAQPNQGLINREPSAVNRLIPRWAEGLSFQCLETAEE